MYIITEGYFVYLHSQSHVAIEPEAPIRKTLQEDLGTSVWATN